MSLLGLTLGLSLKYRLGIGDIVHVAASGFESMEEFGWNDLGLVLGALAMKKRYEPDPRMDEVIDKLSQIDIRSREA
jgi:hypothetical protein